MTTTFPSEPRSWLRALTALVLLVCAIACKSRPAPLPAGSATERRTDLAPAAPAGLLFGATIARPGEVWSKLRPLGGAGLAPFPTTFPMLIAALLDLPSVAAGAIDEAAPLGVGCVARDGRPEFVLAVHTRSGRELSAALTTGAAPWARATTRGDWVELHRITPAAKQALAIDGDYLIVASSAQTLEAAGLYASRKLARSPVRAEVDATVRVEARAFAEAAPSWLQAWWRETRSTLVDLEQQARQDHKRAADFGNPQSVIAALDVRMTGLVEVLKSLGDADAELRVYPDHLDVRARVATRPDSPAAANIGTSAGAASGQLLDLPADTRAACYQTSAPDQRKQDAERWTEELSAIFGKRLGASDRERIAGALRDLAESRGDDISFAVTDATLGVRAAVRDAERFGAAVERLLLVLQRPAFAEPFARWVGRPSVTTSRVGDARRARITFSGGAAEVHAAWSVEQERGVLVLAPGASAADAALRNWHTPERRLSSSGVISAAAQQRLASSTMALLARPDRWAIGTAPAPLLLALGPDGTGAALHLEVPASVVEYAILKAGQK